MTRLNFEKGDRVVYTWDDKNPTPHVILTVEPALQAPYWMSDHTWRGEADLLRHNDLTPSWEDVEAHIKGIVQELRVTFQAHNESHLVFNVEASGRPDGDIKIEYTINDSDYGASNKKSSYSLRPALEEFFRSKKWKERNEALALTYDGGDDDII